MAVYGQIYDKLLKTDPSPPPNFKKKPSNYKQIQINDGWFLFRSSQMASLFLGHANTYSAACSNNYYLSTRVAGSTDIPRACANFHERFPRILPRNGPLCFLFFGGFSTAKGFLTCTATHSNVRMHYPKTRGILLLKDTRGAKKYLAVLVGFEPGSNVQPGDHAAPKTELDFFLRKTCVIYL